MLSITFSSDLEDKLPKIEILQVGPYPKWDEDRLNDHFEVHRYFEATDRQAFLGQHGKSIRAVATRGELGADQSLIDGLPNLEIISIYGVGFDAVDLDAAKEKSIRVTNTPDVLTKDVADLGLAMMLALSRDLIGGQNWVSSGKWRNEGTFALSTRVHGKRAGILGMGRIGYEVARRLAGFDMDIAYCDIEAKDFAADWTFVDNAVALAQQSDYLFVTLAATAQSHHIVDLQVLEALGPAGMLINISRAANVDEEALLQVLENGQLGSAALDVFENEPELNPRFYQLNNILLQPHHASGTVETRKEMGNLVFENLNAHFAGQQLPTPVL